MEYTTLRNPPPMPRAPKAPKPQKPPQTPARQKKAQQGRCPSGFRWDSKKGKCVQAGVGPEYRP
jgi:hypothetical protein